MNAWIWFFSIGVMLYSSLPLISSMRWLVKYQLLKQKYNEKHPNGYMLIPSVTAIFFAIFLIALIVSIWITIMKYNVFDYLVSVVCCLLLSVTTSDKIYFPADAEITSSIQAIKKGYTEGVSFRLLHFAPLKPAINIFYLLTLVVSHIVSLYYENSAFCESAFYKFLEINKYGIIIMYAFEKVIESIINNKEKERIRILKETEQKIDHDEKESQEELKHQWQKLRDLLRTIWRQKVNQRKNKKK